jgi:hypothetical protein
MSTSKKITIISNSSFGGSDLQHKIHFIIIYLFCEHCTHLPLQTVLEERKTQARILQLTDMEQEALVQLWLHWDPMAMQGK